MVTAETADYNPDNFQYGRGSFSVPWRRGEPRMRGLSDLGFTKAGKR